MPSCPLVCTSVLLWISSSHFHHLNEGNKGVEHLGPSDFQLDNKKSLLVSKKGIATSNKGITTSS